MRVIVNVGVSTTLFTQQNILTIRHRVSTPHDRKGISTKSLFISNHLTELENKEALEMGWVWKKDAVKFLLLSWWGQLFTKVKTKCQVKLTLEGGSGRPKCLKEDGKIGIERSGKELSCQVGQKFTLVISSYLSFWNKTVGLDCSCYNLRSTHSSILMETSVYSFSQTRSPIWLTMENSARIAQIWLASPAATVSKFWLKSNHWNPKLKNHNYCDFSISDSLLLIEIVSST